MPTSPQLELALRPRITAPYVFEHKLAIVCEGLADREFFRRFMKTRKVPQFDVPFPHDPIDTCENNVLVEAQREWTVADEGAQQSGFVL